MTQSFHTAFFSDHARFEMRRRSIDEAMVKEILAKPDTVRDVRPGRIVLHKTFLAKNTQKALLYRVFVDIDRMPPVVVTAYKTSKISKYEKLQ